MFPSAAVIAPPRLFTLRTGGRAYNDAMTKTAIAMVLCLTTLAGVPAVAQETTRNLQTIAPVTVEPPADTPSPTPSPSRSPTFISPPIKFYSVPDPDATPDLAPRTPRERAPSNTTTPQPTPALPAEAPERTQPERQPVQQRAAPAPAPAPVPAPTPAATPAPTETAPATEPAPVIAVPDITGDTMAAEQPVREGLPQWLWLALAGGIVVIGGGLLLLRRRNRGWRRLMRQRERREPRSDTQPARRAPAADAPVAAPEPVPAPVPVAAKSVRSTAEPLQVAIRPLRAGTVQGEGAIEFLIAIDNPGGVDAEDVVVAAWLRSAHPQQDAEIAQLLAAPPSPYLPKTRIAAGGSREIQSRLTLPRNRMRVMQARGRPYFIPMIVVDVRYKANGTRHSAAVAMVGRRQQSGDKLGPIFLDQPSRMHDGVEARAHRVTVPA